MDRARGILPALLTPMDGEGRVRVDGFPPMIDWLFSQGVAGLYICGTNGEGMLLSEEERRQVTEAVVDAVPPRAKVIVHVGSVATDESVRLARHAEGCGAHAVAAVPPFAFGRNPEGMATHYRAIADACSLPLYLYNIPSMTGVSVTAEMVRPLLDELPSIVGLKFSDDSLFSEFRLVEIREDFDVLHGSDETLLYALMMGAVGGIGLIYNFMPKLAVTIYDRFSEGDLAGANELQLRLSRFTAIFLKHAKHNSVALAKAYMGSIGFDVGRARPPNPPLGGHVLNEFLAELKSVGFTPEV